MAALTVAEPVQDVVAAAFDRAFAFAWRAGQCYAIKQLSNQNQLIPKSFKRNLLSQIHLRFRGQDLTPKPRQDYLHEWRTACRAGGGGGACGGGAVQPLPAGSSPAGRASLARFAEAARRTGLQVVTVKLFSILPCSKKAPVQLHQPQENTTYQFAMTE